MSDIFGAEFFTGNRQRLRSLFGGTAPIVIAANGLMQRNADTAYPFRQDSNFWYLTGIEEPDLVLVMDRDREYIICPSRGAERDIFDGQIDPSSMARISGITSILDEKTGWRLLSGRLKRAKHFAGLPVRPGYSLNHGIYTNPARSVLSGKVLAQNPKIELIDIGPHLISQRVVKQPEEIAAITEANKITMQAFRKIASRGLDNYGFEYKVEASLTNSFNNAGVQHGYSPIVASGGNACTLHYNANQSVIRKKDLVLIDAGAEVSNYSADITRTYTVGSPSKRQSQIHKAVLELQTNAISLLKPGVILKTYEEQVRHLAGEKLREIGLIKAISKEAVDKYYPHATSHFLGLAVHDVGNYQKPLKAGMVLTVEPGIYTKKEGIGIRIEDNILITSTGAKNLTAGLSREL